MNSRLYLVSPAAPEDRIIPEQVMTCSQVEEFFCQIIEALRWDLPVPRLVIDPTLTAFSGQASQPGDGWHHSDHVVTISAGWLYLPKPLFVYLIIHELAHSALQATGKDWDHSGHFCLLLAVFLSRGSTIPAIPVGQSWRVAVNLALYDAHESKIPAGAVIEWAQRTAPHAPVGVPVSELVEWAGAEIKQFWEAWSQRQAVRQHRQRRESHKLAAMASLSALVVLATLVAGAVSLVLS